MNKVVLVGRLTKDPELTFAKEKGTAIAKFSIAVDRRFKGKDGQKEADFINIVVIGKQAENCTKFTGKGKLISVSGRIQTGSYVAKDGQKRYTTDVVADELQFIEWLGGNKPTTQKGNSEMNEGNNSGNTGNFGEDITPIDDSDIPF